MRDEPERPPTPPRSRAHLAGATALVLAIGVGLAGTLLLGIYPRPFIDWIVAASLMFSNITESTATLSLTSLPLGG